MRMDRSLLALHIAPPHDFAPRKGSPLRIAALDAVKNVSTRRLDWRGLEKRQLLAFPSDAIKRTMKALDMFFPDRDNFYSGHGLANVLIHPSRNGWERTILKSPPHATEVPR